MYSERRYQTYESSSESQVDYNPLREEHSQRQKRPRCGGGCMQCTGMCKG